MRKEQIKEIFDAFKESAIREYFDFVRIPSVSSEPAHKGDILKGAEWVRSYVEALGFKTEMWESPVHPVLFASWDQAGPQQPTLLIYNHYDVQPADPGEQWESPPFEPTVRDGEVFARGAQDNKGQCFYVLQALKVLLKATGTLPVNVKLVIEGEEECGSIGLHSLVKEKQKELKADYLAIVDLTIPKIDEPALTLGIRGLITMDITATGSKTDLHSGLHGGIVYNPIAALVQVFSQLKDAQGKIAIPGYYDDLLPLAKEERDAISFEFDEKGYFAEVSAYPTGGEKNFTPNERAWIRPTIEINGIWGGYTGEGFKTVIPAKAHAKLSCRLVPNQDPLKTGKMVADFIKAKAPEGIEIEVEIHAGGGPAARFTASSKLIEAFAKAYSEVFGKPCRYIYNGSTIPIAIALAQASGADVVMLGLGLTSDNIHAPNEHFGLNRIEMGVQIMALALENLKKP